MTHAMGEALREGQAGGSRAGRTWAWDEVREEDPGGQLYIVCPEGPSTCRSETCPVACLRSGGPCHRFPSRVSRSPKDPQAHVLGYAPRASLLGLLNQSRNSCCLGSADHLHIWTLT